MIKKIEKWIDDYIITVFSVIVTLWLICIALLTVAALFKYVFF